MIIKVLYIIASIASVRDGSSQNILELAKALHKYGVDTAIATTNANILKLLDVPLCY